MSDQLVRFREHMGGFFHDLLRAAGITMTPTNTNERIRQIGERMAKTIEHAAELKSIEVIKKLQAAVLDAFKKVEERLNAQSQLASAQQELLAQLKRELIDLENRVKSVEERSTYPRDSIDL